MLTGKRAFEGDDVADTLAFVLTREPAWSTLPAVPVAVRRLLRRSLAKNPKQRLADAADARLEIEEALSDQALDIAGAGPAAVDGSLLRIRALPWTLAALAIAAAVLAWWKPSQTSPLRPPLRLSAELGADVSLATDPGGAIALSRDGSTMAFSAYRDSAQTPMIYVRRLDQIQAAPLSGTEGGFAPFFSPDGRSVAFFADGKLKKASIDGGTPVQICDAPQSRGGAWAEDGSIVFASAARAGVLLRVRSTGGIPEAVTALVDGERSHRWPQFLPGDRAVLYTASTTGLDFDNASLVVQPLPSGQRKVVRRGGYAGRFLRSGHLLYVSERTLFAARFDPARLELIDPVVPVVAGVNALNRSGGAQFAVSDDGVLVYFHGLGTEERPMSWLDHTGKTSPLRPAGPSWTNLRFDPDGRRVAFDMINGKNWDVWTYDWERGTSSRITDDSSQGASPVWSPNGRSIVFASRWKKPTQVYWRRSDGSGNAQRLTEGQNPLTPRSWHSSGKFLALTENRPESNGDILILPMDGDESSGWKAGKPSVFLGTSANEDTPEFSPDGRWIAYTADYNGRVEVYVQPFLGPGERTQISSNGGAFPTWSRSRNELFFAESVSGPDAARRLMVATYSVEGGSFRASKALQWSDKLLTWQPGKFFDLHPDGARFAIAGAPQPQGRTRQDTVTFFFNFFDELRRMTTPAR